MRAILVAALLVPALAVAAPRGQLDPPPGATLLGELQVTEIHEFPEMRVASVMPVESALAVTASDRLYQLGGTYAESVSAFDGMVARPGFRRIARSVTRTATAWTLRRPDGSLATAIVRDTRPVTLEIVQQVGQGFGGM